MGWIIGWVVRRPAFAFALLLGGSIASIWQLPKLKVNVSPEGLMRTNDPEKAFYDQTLKTFGSDNVTVVFIEDVRLFNPAKLEALRGVVDALSDIPGVIRVESLFSLKNFKTVDGALQSAPFLDEIPQTPPEAEAVLKDAVRNPLIARNAISTDGKAMAVNVYVRNPGTDPGFEEKLADSIEEAIAPLQGTFERIFQIGMPYTRKVLGATVVSDQKLLTGLAVIALLAGLAICMRSFSGAAVPLSTSGLSILWTFGFMAAVDIPINILTSIIPALLLITGSNEDMHLLAEYDEGVEAGHDRQRAILYMAGKIGVALVLTFLTSYLGFFSITFNDIRMLQQFGIVASTGLALNLIITLLVIPLYLSYFGRRAVPGPEAVEEGFLQRGIAALVKRLQPWRRAVFFVVAVSTALVAMGAFKVRVNNNLMGYFKDDSPIRIRSGLLNQRLSGMQTFYIVLTAPEAGAFLEPHFLKQVKALQEQLAATGRFDASFSFADYLAIIHREMSAGGSATLSVPDTKELVEQYRLLLSRQDIEQYVSADFRQAAILVRHHIEASHDLNEALGALAPFLGTLDRRLAVQFTGEEILTNKACDSMASGQAKSLLTLVVTIFVMISIVFLNVKAGLLAMIPNLVPIIALFGIMGTFGIPLDIGTTMIANIAIGICVDDTIHFMVRYNKEMREVAKESVALDRVIRAEAVPVVATTVAVSLGFGMLMASSFNPVIFFGALTGVIMVIGLCTDLVLTPILLSTTRFVTLWDMLAVDVGRKFIEDCELFRGMRTWQVRKVISLCKVREIPAGETFVRQGEEGHEMFVVLSGKIGATKTRRSKDSQDLGEYGPGAVLGEIAMVVGQTRAADLRAVTDAKLLVLQWHALENLGRVLPMITAPIFLNIAKILGKRLTEKE